MALSSCGVSRSYVLTVQCSADVMELTCQPSMPAVGHSHGRPVKGAGHCRACMQPGS